MLSLCGVLHGRRLLMVAVGLAVAAAALTAPRQQAEAQGFGDSIVALTGSNRLVRFNSFTPFFIISSVSISGLAPGDSLAGIDYRPANGVLYGVGRTGQLYSINADSGVASPVGGPFAIPLQGTEFGVDFNPVPDRLRVVSNTGQNLRINPNNGAVVDGDATTAGTQPDGALVYVDQNGQPVQGGTGSLVGAAYTNNFAGASTTTNYGIDARLGLLVTQGSINGSPVSPNTGRLFVVGRLNVQIAGPVGFDISRSGRTYASITDFSGASNLFLVDLTTGATTFIGTAGGGEQIRGFAIVP